MTKVLFVCLGNICRSPAAEGYFKSLLISKGLGSKYLIDSAGTSAYHSGEPADGRMRENALKRGYELNSISRSFDHKTDYANFDYIITMDHTNYQDVIDLSPDKISQERVFPMTDFCTVHDVHQVPDPYYKGVDGFRLTFEIIEDACNGFFSFLEKKGHDV